MFNFLTRALNRLREEFHDFTGFFTDFLSGCWETVWGVVNRFWISITTVVGLVTVAVVTASDMVSMLIGFVTGATSGAPSVGTASGMVYYFIRLANTIFPIEELFAFLGTWTAGYAILLIADFARWVIKTVRG